jgi:hypothetical protein
MTDIKSPEDKIAAAILTLASALRDQNLESDGSLENIFGFYLPPIPRSSAHGEGAS